MEGYAPPLLNAISIWARSNFSTELVKLLCVASKNSYPITNVSCVGDDGMSLGHEPGRGEEVL